MSIRMFKQENFLFTALRLVKGEDVLIVGIATYLAGAAAAGSWLPMEKIALLILACMFCMLGVAGVNSMNQIHDFKIDKINKPKRPLPSLLLSWSQVRFLSSGLLVIGAFLSIILWILVSPIYFFIGCFGFGTALLYSLPQVRLKKYPIISTAIMGFGYGPFLFIAGWVVLKPISEIPLWVLFFLYFHETFILITKDYRDYLGDLKYNIRTLPVILGKKYSAILNYFLYIIPFILLYLTGYFGLLSLDSTILLVYGIFIGLPMFICCGQDNLKINVLGYYIYIFAFILVRIFITLILI